jgi:plastocyanin
MRRLLLILSIAALALAAAATTSATTPKPKTYTVKTGDDFFSPTSRTIHKNDIVKWVWVGEDKKPGETVNQHTIIDANQDKPYFKNAAPRTKGTFSVRFKKTGNFKIFCSEHYQDGMILKVKVKNYN